MWARLHDLSVARDGGWLLTIRTNENVGGLFDELHECDVDVTVKKYRKKRSLDANRLLWKMITEIADVLGAKKEAVYRDYIRDYGAYKDFTLTEDEANTFQTAWSALGEGWQTDKVDFAEDGCRFVIRAYYGSSVYDTKRMSRILDAVIQDAKEMGIETLGERELSLLKEEWHGNLEKHSRNW